MRAIRPIYDGKDDLDGLDAIDHIDMMACLFSEINERIDLMDDITEDESRQFRRGVNKEVLCTEKGVVCAEKGINDDMNLPPAEDEFESHRGTDFDELIVMFEIVRWMEENGYDWDSVVTAKYRSIALALGIFSSAHEYKVGEAARDDYVLNVEPQAFHELKVLLPLHWATILLDWYPFIVNGIDNREMIEFGNIMIVRRRQ